MEKPKSYNNFIINMYKKKFTFFHMFNMKFMGKNDNTEVKN